jgi:hypothetical protein
LGSGGSVAPDAPTKKVGGGITKTFTLNCHSYLTLRFFVDCLRDLSICFFTFLCIKAIVFLLSPSLSFQFQSCHRPTRFEDGFEDSGGIFCIVKSFKGERIGLFFFAGTVQLLSLQFHLRSLATILWLPFDHRVDFALIEWYNRSYSVEVEGYFPMRENMQGICRNYLT